MGRSTYSNRRTSIRRFGRFGAFKKDSFDHQRLLSKANGYLSGIKNHNRDLKQVVQPQLQLPESFQRWPIGTILEAKMCGSNKYYDTIHPVRVVSFDRETGMYWCGLLAFDQEAETSYDDWSEDQLREPSELIEMEKFEFGDKIQFKWRNRKVDNIADIDGLCADEGIWVRGVMVANLKRNDQFLVEYRNWSENTEKVFFTVQKSDIRRDYYL